MLDVSIEMIIFCHNFQRRLSWLLSSIVEQRGEQPPILVSIACLRNNGDPTTEALQKYYGDRFNLPIRLSYFDDDQDMFARRGLTRNRQIKESRATWLFFADADNVYPPTFFNGLGNVLINRFGKFNGCINSPAKWHTTVHAADRIVRRHQKRMYIKGAYKKAAGLPRLADRSGGIRIAGGAMQVVRREAIRRYCNDMYVDPERCKDRHLFKQVQHAKSDVQFRDRLGHRSKFIRLEPQIHLNHRRDKEEKHHIEAQR